LTGRQIIIIRESVDHDARGLSNRFAGKKLINGGLLILKRYRFDGQALLGFSQECRYLATKKAPERYANTLRRG
jgi:hypothetical protein